MGRELLAILCIVIVLVFGFAFMTKRGTLEWTFDGVHHTLLIGNTKP